MKLKTKKKIGIYNLYFNLYFTAISFLMIVIIGTMGISRIFRTIDAMNYFVIYIMIINISLLLVGLVLSFFWYKVDKLYMIEEIFINAESDEVYEMAYCISCFDDSEHKIRWRDSIYGLCNGCFNDIMNNKYIKLFSEPCNNQVINLSKIYQRIFLELGG